MHISDTLYMYLPFAVECMCPQYYSWADFLGPPYSTTALNTNGQLKGGKFRHTDSRSPSDPTICRKNVPRETCYHHNPAHDMTKPQNEP